MATATQSEMPAAGGAASWRGRLGRYGPLVAWLAFIFFASTGEMSAANTSRIVGPLLRWLYPAITEAQLAAAHFVVRKLAHFTEYAVLALLAARAFRTSTHAPLRRRRLIIALLLVAAYALSDEFHQSFVPTRTASVYDSLIDTAGGATALLLLALRQRRRAKRRLDKRPDFA
ncbi:MAG TPA: VanZ family protein [Pyrinomonadaceae bacterium]|jgi:VanZ family protein